MKRYLLIVAGGFGRRMDSQLPKQFLLLDDRPVLMHTIERLSSMIRDASVVVVLPSTYTEYWGSLLLRYGFSLPHTVVEGGEERFHSVVKGLACLPGEGLVAIHDGVRPLVSEMTVRRCFDEVTRSEAVIPVVAPAESVRMATVRGTMPLNRESVLLVQTPQVFRLDLIKRAYARDYDIGFTDDAIVAEKAGIAVTVVEGNRENIKITTPADLLYAEAVLKAGFN